MSIVKAKDIEAGMRNIEITGRIVNMSAKKRVNTRYGLADLAKAMLVDETGSIPINLWRQQIDQVQEGQNVIVKNGFVRIYGGRLELNIGKDGQIYTIEEKLGTY